MMENASVVRELIRRLWQANPHLNSDILDDLLLMVSELFSNAVRHTWSGEPGGRVGLAIAANEKWVRVEVTDEGSRSIPQAMGKVTEEEALSPGGWGLALVGMRADTWGHRPRGNGRVVWFEKGSSEAVDG
ncbi:ATP-binding protein [Spongiactinospora rosea]|uniref:ATP-binding protein n=1 Tax=Spongiactinospora rosea TaxID=2248750 RepID=UPI001CEC3D23|nr:ATP-binding protein [Spongiactinospora rosea]